MSTRLLVNRDAQISKLIIPATSIKCTLRTTASSLRVSSCARRGGAAPPSRGASPSRESTTDPSAAPRPEELSQTEAPTTHSRCQIGYEFDYKFFLSYDSLGFKTNDQENKASYCRRSGEQKHWTLDLTRNPKLHHSEEISQVFFYYLFRSYLTKLWSEAAMGVATSPPPNCTLHFQLKALFVPALPHPPTHSLCALHIILLTLSPPLTLILGSCFTIHLLVTVAVAICPPLRVRCCLNALLRLLLSSSVRLRLLASVLPGPHPTVEKLQGVQNSLQDAMIICIIDLCYCYQ